MSFLKNNTTPLIKHGDDIVSIAYRAYDVLKNATILSPKNPAVCYVLDELFWETTFLARTIDVAYSDMILQRFEREFLIDFRNLLNKSEEEMEYYWSAKIFSTPHATYKNLESFIYWDNYVALVSKEHALLQTHGAPLNAKACFIGQGPLPMTMLIYNQMTGAACRGVDIALRATRNAQRLSLAIASQKCEYVHEDGCTHDYADCDIVFIASLVPVKDEIIRKIKADRQDKTTYIMVRTAENLSRLYYEPYHCVVDGLDYLGKTEYGADCINTTFLYRYN